MIDEEEEELRKKIKEHILSRSVDVECKELNRMFVGSVVPGSRVVVFLDQPVKGIKSMRIIGLGTYVGMHTPSPEAVVMDKFRWADFYKEHPDKTTAMIILDDGGVVYGCECWWASESFYTHMLEAHKEIKIVPVGMDPVRERREKVGDGK